MITSLFTVVFMWPALSRLPIKLTEHRTKTHLWHDMFAYLTYKVKICFANDDEQPEDGKRLRN